MNGIFPGLLGMGVSACPLMIAVILLRRLLIKAPKYIRLILWAMVGIRLLCPLTVESVFSLSLPPDVFSGSYFSSQASGGADRSAGVSVPENNGGYQIPAYAATSLPSDTTGTGYDAADYTHADSTDGTAVHDAAKQGKNGTMTALSHVWLAGLAAMSAYGAWSCLSLKKRTAASIRLRDNIFVCDGVESPFVLGFTRPRIMIPSCVGNGQLGYIEAHERTHIARGDHIWKPLGFALLAVYWFHPLAWVSYVLFCRDIEYACDERVVKAMDLSDKQEYSRTLLEYSVSQRSMAVCPVAFGEVGVKDRVRSVLGYKKPAVWIIGAAALLCAIAGVCFMTTPITKTLDSGTEAYLHQVILERGSGSGLTSENSAPFEDHIILRADKKGDITTVYALVWYGEYEMNGSGEIEEVSGWHVPAVITLDMSGNSSDYREPRYGSYYSGDIREMFPFGIRSKALNISDYSEEQGGRCMEQARRYYMTADIAGMNIGAEMPRTIYADEHIVVMTGTFGMLVYDMDKREIRDRLSYDRLHDMGLNYFAAKADAKGEKVLLADFSPDNGAMDFRYSYNVTDGSVEAKEGLNEEAESMTAFDVLHSPFSSQYDDWKGFDEFVGEMNNDHLIGFEAADIGDSFIFTRAEPDWDMATLQIVRRYYGRDKKDVFDVFPDVPRLSAALEPVPSENIIWDSCAVNYIGEGWDLMSKAGAYEPAVPGSMRHAPILKISGEDGLAAFIETAGGAMCLDNIILDGKSFDSITKGCDAAYFEQYDLLLIYLYSFDMGTRFSLGNVSRNGNKLSVSVTKESPDPVAELGEVGWLLAVSIPKEQMDGTEFCEAFIGSVISDDTQLADDAPDGI